MSINHIINQNLRLYSNGLMRKIVLTESLSCVKMTKYFSISVDSKPQLHSAPCVPEGACPYISAHQLPSVIPFVCCKHWHHQLSWTKVHSPRSKRLTYCTAHTLNLVGAQCSQCKFLQISFVVLFKLSNFSMSTSCWHVITMGLQAKEKNLNETLKTLSDTRWPGH